MILDIVRVIFRGIPDNVGFNAVHRRNGDRMKTRIFLLTSLFTALAVIVGIFVLTNRSPLPDASAPVSIALSSNPFPLGVGPMRLRVSVSGADAATIEVENRVERGGVLTLTSFITPREAGEFDVAVTYPRAGEWTIGITAKSSAGEVIAQENFPVYVYPVPPPVRTSTNTYRSESEIMTAVASNPEKELWVVIPLGASELSMHGISEDLIPSEIRLQVSSRNRLIIQNNDVRDHNIGPFFVRAGETIRQEFSQPAIYEGTCSIRASDEINIIVEE